MAQDTKRYLQAVRLRDREEHLRANLKRRKDRANLDPRKDCARGQGCGPDAASEPEAAGSGAGITAAPADPRTQGA